MELREVEDEEAGEAAGARPGEELRRTAMLLLERQFLHDGDYGIGSFYRIAVEKRAHFAELFDGLGLDFLVRTEEGFVGVLPRGLTRRRMNAEESLFGVALRLAYEKGVESRDIGERGRVSILVSEVWDLAEAARPGRQRPLGLGAARDILARYSSRGIVSVLEDLPDGDAAIEIRPCIRLVLSDEVLKRMAVDATRVVAIEPDSEPSNELVAQEIPLEAKDAG